MDRVFYLQIVADCYYLKNSVIVGFNKVLLFCISLYKEYTIFHFGNLCFSFHTF